MMSINKSILTDVTVAVIVLLCYSCLSKKILKLKYFPVCIPLLVCKNLLLY